MALVDLDVLFDEQVVPSESFLSGEVHSSAVSAEGLQFYHLVLEEGHHLQHVLQAGLDEG